jgi:cyclic pyranopterin phosphate synthase
MLVDGCGRRIDYLRVSVTDRCDLRCAYCLPQDYCGYEAPAQWLSADEIVRLCRIFVSLGVTGIRLTGGEPLVRGGIDALAKAIGAIPGLEDLSLSTNGTRLARHAATLRAAGIDRLNVSLDTLSRERFAALTGRDALPGVLAGLEAARDAGYRLIKINMVWLPDRNADEIDAMIDYCRARGFVLRLIENMPIGDAARQLGSASLQPLIGELRERHRLIDHVVPGGGPARYLSTADRRFSIGFITPLSQHFCATCNRVRLSVAGDLHLCLGDDDRIDLRAMLRADASDNEIIWAIEAALVRKPRQHDFRQQPAKIVRVMAATGG